MGSKQLKTLQALVLILAVVLTAYIFITINDSKDTDRGTAKEEVTNSKLDNPEKLTGENIENLDNILARVENNEVIDPSKLLAGEDQKADLVISEAKGKQVVEKETKENEDFETDLEFSPSIYPYRAMLSDDYGLDYDQIYEAITNLEKTVTLTNQVSIAAIKDIMLAIFADHPELFYINTNYTYCYTSSGKVLSVELDYNITANALENSRTKFLKAAAEIINEANSLETDLEKEQYVYAALQEKCGYVNDCDLNQSAYSCLVNNQSVCAGYSRAFQYIMQQLNIPCYFCLGYVNSGNHAWNIVYIDGEYYNVDLSWDDALGNLTEKASYTYFNISDAAIGLDHARRDLSQKLPECKTTLKKD